MHAADVAFAILFNSLWQAPIIALLTWGILRVAHSASSSTRYAAWMIALAAAIVMPVVTSFITAAAPSSAVTSSPATHSTAPVHPPKVSAVPQKSEPSAAAPAAKFTLQRLRFNVPREIVLGVIGVWVLAAIALLARLFIDLLALERLKRDALPLPVEYRDELERWREAAPLLRTVRLCVSSNTEVPVAVGLFDSMILLPSHLLESFSAREIDQIALHELAHLQRADDWSNGVQRIIAALLFFNPAIRWIAHKLDLERELACDDHVVALTRDVRPYAKCLAKMAEVTAWPHHALAAPGVFVTRKSISVRIEQLLKRRSTERGPVSYRIIAAGAAATCAFFAAATLLTPVIASPAFEPVPVRTRTAVAGHKSTKTTKTTVPQVAANAPAVQRVVVYVTPTPDVSTPLPALPPKTAVAAQSTVIAAATPRPRSHRHEHRRARVSSGLNCVGCSLAGIDWSNRDLHGMDLRGANLADANLTNADMHDVDLSGANLSGARLAGANLKGAILRGANLAGLSFAGVDLNDADLSGANIDARRLDPATLRTLLARCTGCNFAGADFRNQNLRGVQVTGANLDHADFRGADLSDASFKGANFDGAQFNGARLDGAQFIGCNFSGVDMRTADFSRASLVGSNLSGAILQ